ncbi:M20/M25/M40 family metallo-hydrolase [Candidatus Bathyarchaeota archaeon]|nr:M20/M25/M40 family metallo-hydrolase [Candidatus Bathyarchaeota archaeon]
MLSEVQVLELAKTLVSIRSDGSPEWETGILHWLEEFFQDKPVKMVFIDTGLEDGRDNLLILPRTIQGITREKKAGFKGEGLLFCGHMDVVHPGDLDTWHSDPFKPWIGNGDDGKEILHGRGTSDMKGALAAFIVSFLSYIDAINEATKQDRVIGLLFTVDEEVGLRGADAFASSSHARLFDKAILGEPTRMIPVRGHKGVLFERIKVSGRAAHGSVPDQGISAIKIAMDFYHHLEKAHEEGVTCHSHPLLGDPTLNLGVFRGGTAPNVVPDECTLEIDRRITKGENVEDVRQGFRDMVDAMHLPDGAMIKEECINSRPPYYLDDDEPFLSFIESLLGPATIMNGYTEAGCYFNDGGISTIILGPGSIDQAHVANEHVAIAQLDKAVDVYSSLIRSYLGD